MEAQTNPTGALQELAAFVNDGKLGYEKAAQETMNEAHRTVYRGLSAQRAAFVEDLNRLIREHGGEKERSQVIQGELYRQWVDTKTSTGGDDETLVLANVQLEEWTLKAYDQVLGNGALAAPARQRVEEQRQAIEKSLSQLQEMRLSA
ncbi:MAG: PA2169 family four-helix-bundle protein [Ferruginibacter sp.]|nr:PA2169 family four-helix-bundle protein [Cytophagales bacterium]